MSDAPSRAISHQGGLVFACPCRCYRDLAAWLGHPLDIRLVDLPSGDGERHLALVAVDNARMLAAFYRAELGPWLRFLAAAAATNQRPEIPAIDTRDVEIVDGAQLQAQAAAAGSDPFVDLGAPFYVLDYTAAIAPRPDTCPTSGRPADDAEYRAALQAAREALRATNPVVDDDLLAANRIRIGDHGWVAVAESDTITSARQAVHAAGAFFERRHPGALVDYAAAEAEVSPTDHPYTGWLVDVTAAIVVAAGARPETPDAEPATLAQELAADSGGHGPRPAGAGRSGAAGWLPVISPDCTCDRCSEAWDTVDRLRCRSRAIELNPYRKHVYVSRAVADSRERAREMACRFLILESWIELVVFPTLVVDVERDEPASSLLQGFVFEEGSWGFAFEDAAMLARHITRQPAHGCGARALPNPAAAI